MEVSLLYYFRVLLTLSKRAFGRLSEERAAKFLAQKNFQILARNFHTPEGEVDLIARDQDLIVFVEVKARRSAKFGTALEAVTPAKLARVVKAGEVWLERNGYAGADFRVDVVGWEGGRVEYLCGV